MGKKTEVDALELTQDQLDILSNCSKVSNFLFFVEGSDTIVSTNSLEESFTILFAKKGFGFKPTTDKIVMHNLSAVIKTIKTIGRENCVIKFGEDKFFLSDKDGNIKCNYLYANKKIVSTVMKVHTNIDDIIEGVKDNPESKTFTFKKSYFSLVKTLAAEHNTMSFNKDKIVMYDNTGSTEISDKSNTEIKIDSGIEEDIRFDVDLSLFGLVCPDDYQCTISPDGFILFESESAGIYGIAANILK